MGSVVSRRVDLHMTTCKHLSQIRYLLVVILGVNSVSEVQYKEVMIIDDE